MVITISCVLPIEVAVEGQGPGGGGDMGYPAMLEEQGIKPVNRQCPSEELVYFKAAHHFFSLL